MTCIAAVSHKGRVWMGGDSRASADDYAWKSTPKVWRAGCFVIGICGGQSWETLLRYGITWPQQLDELERHMLASLPAEVREAARRSGVAIEEGDGALIGVRGGSLWELAGDECAVVSEDYAATGSAFAVALGALSATQGVGPKRRVTRALEAAARHRTDVAAPFSLVVL